MTTLTWILKIMGYKYTIWKDTPAKYFYCTSEKIGTASPSAKLHFVFNNDLTMESLVKFLNLVDFCPTSEDKADMMRGLKGIEIIKLRSKDK